MFNHSRKAFRLVSLVLAAVLMMSVAGSALAAGSPMTEWSSDTFSFSFGGGEWYEMGETSGVKYYCQNNQLSMNGAFLITETELPVDTSTLGDSMIDTLYDTLINGLATSAVDKKVNSSDATIAGVKARFFDYKQDTGTVLHVYGFGVLKGNKVLLVCYIDQSSSDDAVQQKIKDVADTVVAK